MVILSCMYNNKQHTCLLIGRVLIIGCGGRAPIHVCNIPNSYNNKTISPPYVAVIGDFERIYGVTVVSRRWGDFTVSATYNRAPSRRCHSISLPRRRQSERSSAFESFFYFFRHVKHFVPAS